MSKVETRVTIDDMGYEDFVNLISSEIKDRAESDSRPCDGRIVRGYVQRLNGVVSDDHITVIWEKDRIAGIAIAVRTSGNLTQTVEIDLTRQHR